MTKSETLYLNSLYDVSKHLASAYDDYLATYKIDLTKTQVTEIIIQRLKAYYESQILIKKLLDKGYLAAAADFFVETVLFFIRLHLQQTAPHLKAFSEKEILLDRYRKDDGKIKRDIIRPDIAIYDGDEVKFLIECKTQLGRKRTKWEEEFDDRKRKLGQKFPNAKAFLLVMTEDNWGGFGNHINVGVEYFALLKNKIWPTNYTSSSQISTAIEGLFKQLR